MALVALKSRIIEALSYFRSLWITISNDHCNMLPSPLSLFPRESSTSCATTLTSVTSSSTIPGIGALSGKMLKALGKAQLRALENLIVHRRLSSIISCFPRDDSHDMKHIDEMYDDLLELSRPGYYHPKVRYRALQIIMKQVELGETHRLMQSLSNWPSVETELFAIEFLNAPYYHRYLLPGRTVSSILQDNQWLYYDLPLVDFVCQLAQLNVPTYLVLLENGLLDMMLKICINEMRPWTTEALTVCNAALSVCVSVAPESAHIISAHPISALWPLGMPFFMRTPHCSYPLQPNLSRRAAWRKVGGTFTQRRLDEISQRLALRSTMYLNESLAQELDVCIDLLELSGQNTHNTDIREIAGRCLEDVTALRDLGYLQAHKLCLEAIKGEGN